MTPELFRRAREVFGEAVDLPFDQRELFLRDACGTDRALRAEVEALLAEPDATTLADGIVSAARTLDPPAAGTRVGPWELVKEIGRGGMGTVHLARRADGAFERDVALKLVGPGLDSKAFLERFHRERQILASLTHPNIAALLDGGTTAGGRPYLVMEFVDGRHIDDFCREEKLPISSRLRLFLAICSAVQYSHRNLVVHRDLKPSNILVTREGAPKLLDFGLARLLGGEGGERTATELQALTPAYASPEQIRGNAVTTATDVYSLGAVLYALLTGRPPHGSPDRSDLVAILNAVLTKDAERPSSAAPEARVPQDLDEIVLKALRKDPDARYSSADQLARDIERFLEGRPVEARRGSAAYRARKFARRHWTGLTAAALVAASLVAGLLLANVQRRKAEKRFEDVRKLAGAVIFDLHDGIAVLPGSTKVREKLVKTAIEYVDTLAREGSSDPDLQREIAAAYERLGMVQGGGNQNLGDRQAARESYRKAIGIREALASARGATDADRLNLARVYTTLGQIDADEAPYRKALGILEEMLRRKPRDAAVRLDLAATHSSISMGRGGRQDYAGALAERRIAHALMEELAREKPEDRRIQRELGLSCKHLGSLLQQRKELPEALALYRQAVSIDEKRLETNPNDAQARLDLSFSLGSVSTCMSALQDPVSAIAYRERAVALRQEIAAKDPDDRWANLALADGLGRLGLLQYYHEEYAAARESHQRALAILRTWSEKDPKSEDLRRLMAVRDAWLAMAESGVARQAPRSVATTQLTAARAHLQKSNAALEPFFRATPNDPAYAETRGLIASELTRIDGALASPLARSPGR